MEKNNKQPYSPYPRSPLFSIDFEAINDKLRKSHNDRIQQMLKEFETKSLNDKIAFLEAQIADAKKQLRYYTPRALNEEEELRKKDIQELKAVYTEWLEELKEEKTLHSPVLDSVEHKDTTNLRSANKINNVWDIMITPGAGTFESDVEESLYSHGFIDKNNYWISSSDNLVLLIIELDNKNYFKDKKQSARVRNTALRKFFELRYRKL
jgi:hypothetical protein